VLITVPSQAILDKKKISTYILEKSNIDNFSSYLFYGNASIVKLHLSLIGHHDDREGNCFKFRK